MHQLLESQNALPLLFLSVVPPVLPLKYDSFTMHKIPTGIVSQFPQHLFMDVCFWILWMHYGHTNGADNCCGNFTPEPLYATSRQEDDLHLRHHLPKVAGDVTHVAFMCQRNAWQRQGLFSGMQAFNEVGQRRCGIKDIKRGEMWNQWIVKRGGNY